MSKEEENKNRLEQERAGDQNHQPSQQDQKQAENKKPKASFKNLAKNIASATSLIGGIELKDIFFMSAIMLALLKDLFDLGIVGTLMTPLTFFTTIAAMLICGSNDFFGKKKATTLLLGNLFEIIPGLNFLPVETLSTLLIYVFILQERKDNKNKKAEEKAEINNGAT